MEYDPKEFEDVIREASLSLVTEFAPEEASSYDDIREEMNSAKSHDVMLGFGVDAISFLTTPAAIGMVSSVAGFLFSEVVKSLKEESAQIIKAKLKKVFSKSRDAKPEDLPALSRNQFEHLRKLAVESAIKSGADEALAERMALSLIGSMNLPPPKT